PTFAAPESCAVALHALSRAPISLPERATSPVSSPATGEPVVGAGPLNERDSKRIFARFGIPTVREVLVESPQEATKAAAHLGGNVAVKILSRGILHKTEANGVALNVKANDAAQRCAEMEAAIKRSSTATLDGFLLQEMVTGVEMILGCHRDPQFGAA